MRYLLNNDTETQFFRLYLSFMRNRNLQYIRRFIKNDKVSVYFRYNRKFATELLCSIRNKILYTYYFYFNTTILSNVPKLAGHKISRERHKKNLDTHQIKS